MISEVLGEDIEGVVSRYEEELSSVIRYARYMAGETTSEWEKLLGPTVALKTHGGVTARIVEEFINYDDGRGLELSREEGMLMIITGHVHDWGEVIIDHQGVGDVSYDQKDDGDVEIERLMFQILLETIDSEPSRELINRAYEISIDKELRLGRIFNAVERVGFMRTTLRAYEGIEGQRINNWKGLVGNTLSNQIKVLCKYANDYPYVLYLLEENTSAISVMFREVLSASVPNDATGKESYDISKLRENYIAWKEWVE